VPRPAGIFIFEEAPQPGGSVAARPLRKGERTVTQQNDTTQTITQKMDNEQFRQLFHGIQISVGVLVNDNAEFPGPLPE
jgi:hypothetical protein